MAEIKTKPTTQGVEDFINGVKDEQQRKDCFAILELMRKASGEVPKMWGSSMIGFGDVRYKSPASGREVDWFRLGFSPRKANLSIHLCMNIQEHAPDLKKLGAHKTGVGCLYIKKLTDVKLDVLKKMIATAAKRKIVNQVQENKVKKPSQK